MHGTNVARPKMTAANGPRNSIDNRNTKIPPTPPRMNVSTTGKFNTPANSRPLSNPSATYPPHSTSCASTTAISHRW